MNTIQIFGRIGADAENRVTPNGLKVTTLRVACNTKKQGQEETTWYKVTLWGDRWDKIMPYLTKGAAVIISGELKKPEIYNDRNGNPQISMEIWAETIRFNPFGGKKEDENSNANNQTTKTPRNDTYLNKMQDNVHGQAIANNPNPDYGFATIGSGQGQGDACEDDIPF